jgi:hypothetical protein
LSRKKPIGKVIGLRGVRLRRVAASFKTGATQYWQQRIFAKIRIGFGFVAQNEYAAPVALYDVSVFAGGAQPHQ